MLEREQQLALLSLPVLLELIVGAVDRVPPAILVRLHLFLVVTGPHRLIMASNTRSVIGVVFCLSVCAIGAVSALLLIGPCHCRIIVKHG